LRTWSDGTQGCTDHRVCGGIEGSETEMILVVWRSTWDDEGPPLDVAYLEVADGVVFASEGAEELVEEALGSVDRSDQAAVDAAMLAYAKRYNRTSSYSYITIGPDMEHMTTPGNEEDAG
jgi:hypothetical protein